MGCDYYVGISLPIEKINSKLKVKSAVLHKGKQVYGEDGLPLFEMDSVDTYELSYKGVIIPFEVERELWDEKITTPTTGKSTSALWLNRDESVIGFTEDRWDWDNLQIAKDKIIESMKTLCNIDVDPADIFVHVHVSC